MVIQYIAQLQTQTECEVKPERVPRVFAVEGLKGNMKSLKELLTPR